MQIAAITNTSYHNNYPSRKTKQTPAFTAHPDFYKFNSTQSCYFRHGTYVVSTSRYKNIEKVYNKVLKLKDNSPKDILIVGIGNSQEPFSHMASAKSILKEKPLKDNVSLYTVDLQSKPDDTKLFDDSFYDGYNAPKYAKSSFEKYIPKKEKKEDDPYGQNELDKLVFKFIKSYNNMSDKNEPVQKEKPCYKVKDEIFEFVKEAYNNPEKSKWDSRIQDVVKDYSDEKFYIISANNILPYIKDEKETVETIQHFKRALKPNGYLITDPEKLPYMELPEVRKNLKEIYPGIYQKTEEL